MHLDSDTRPHADLSPAGEPRTLSVVIPAYNEEDRLLPYLGEILRYLGAGPARFEVIVVDDGSSDATPQVVEEAMARDCRIRLIRLPQNMGKGFAVRTGMLAARGDLRLFADADGATPIAELERLRAAISAGADVAIASRALRDDSCRVNGKLSRKFVGGVFNLIVRLLAVPGVKDTQCGFKLFTAAAAAAVFPLQRIARFGFDVELLFLCRRLGFRITEVPVNWSDVEKSKVSVWRDSPRMFAEVAGIRWNAWQGRYPRKNREGGGNA